MGALAVVDSLDVVDSDLLAWWLAERQTPGGGLNGRPEKLPDVTRHLVQHILDRSGVWCVQVCYSWWVLSSLACLKRLAWIDSAKLTEFILKAQVGCSCPSVSP